MKKKYVVCLLAFSLTFTCISPTGTIVYASEMESSSQQEAADTDNAEMESTGLEAAETPVSISVSSWNTGNGSAYILNGGTIAMEGDSAIAFDEEDGLPDADRCGR